MKTKSIMIFATIAAFALAGCNEQVGRYQLHSGTYEQMIWTEAQVKSTTMPVTEQFHTMFLIDTVTGKVWYAVPDTKSLGENANGPIFLASKGGLSK